MKSKTKGAQKANTKTSKPYSKKASKKTKAHNESLIEELNLESLLEIRLPSTKEEASSVPSEKTREQKVKDRKENFLKKALEFEKQQADFQETLQMFDSITTL